LAAAYASLQDLTSYCWCCQRGLQPASVLSQSWNWSKTSFEVLCLSSVSSDLAVLFIENHRAKQLDTSSIVDTFAQEEARKRKLRWTENGRFVGVEHYSCNCV